MSIIMMKKMMIVIMIVVTSSARLAKLIVLSSVSMQYIQVYNSKYVIMYWKESHGSYYVWKILRFN